MSDFSVKGPWVMIVWCHIPISMVKVLVFVKILFATFCHCVVFTLCWDLILICGVSLKLFCWGCLGCFKDIDELRDSLFAVFRLKFCLFKKNVCVANNVRLAFNVCDS